MSESQVMEALLASLPGKIDQAILTARRPNEDFDLSRLDLTSLRLVQICMHLEQLLGIDIDLEDFDDAERFSDLVRLSDQLVTANGK